MSFYIAVIKEPDFDSRYTGIEIRQEWEQRYTCNFYRMYKQ
jgi:hypothetical protein